MAPLKGESEWIKSAKSLEECLVLIAIRFTAYSTSEGRKTLEASARGLSLAMADVIAGALLCQHAAWSQVKAKANSPNALAAAEAKVDQISAQRWCEELYRRVDHQIQNLGREERFEEDKLMLFKLAEARGEAAASSVDRFGEAKL